MKSTINCTRNILYLLLYYVLQVCIYSCFVLSLRMRGMENAFSAHERHRLYDKFLIALLATNT